MHTVAVPVDTGALILVACISILVYMCAYMSVGFGKLGYLVSRI